MRPHFLLLLAVLSVGCGLPASAHTKDQVGGSFYFYDYALDAVPDDPTNAAGVGQAKMIESQGETQVLEWGQAPYLAHSLFFTPDKMGASISFKIHIAKVQMPTPYDIHTADAAGSEGIYQFLVDDQVTGPDHDFGQPGAWQHGQFSLAAGDYKITYRYIGPSPKAGKPSLNLMRLDIQ